MQSLEDDSNFEVCERCMPSFENILKDMTGHVSKEISLLGLSLANPKPQMTESKWQIFSETLLNFLSRIVLDLKESRADLIDTYCKYLISFYKKSKTQELGKGLDTYSIL